MRRFAFAAAALLCAGFAADALAQQAPQQPGAAEIIQQLRPQTRGIRIPGQEDPPPVQAAGTTAPAGVPALSMMIVFQTGSAELTPAAEAALLQLGAALASPDLAAYRFRIEGHTDTVGWPDQNMILSQRRAASVRDYLVKRFNINPARLETVGFGDSQLLIKTPSQVPEVRNRRVQVLNVGGG